MRPQVGAVLYRKHEGKPNVVSFASRTVSPVEKNNFLHSARLEFLAPKWAVTYRFNNYFMNGPKFEVVTDNNPLRWEGAIGNFFYKYQLNETRHS